MTRPEILSPAGDRERLLAALRYGADAVYLAGRSFGMRAAPDNFDEDGLREAVALSHAAGAKVYVTCNTLPRNHEIAALPSFLELIQDVGADAVIAADLGVIGMVKRYAPRLKLHISTQLGVINYETARTLYDMGASRVILARELSLEEIAGIRAKTGPAPELEVFVHGAMCMAYSGRCSFSHYLTGREANRGDCTQPCRWEFGFTEPKRPGQEFTAAGDDTGSYLFNANDLNMIGHIPELIEAGISAFKIEGRAKAAYYVAAVTNAYKAAVAAGKAALWMAEELNRVSHRPYGTGFFFGEPSQDTGAGGYIRDWQVAAEVIGYRNGRLLLSQRNRFYEGEILSVLTPGQPPFDITATDLRNADGELIEAANQAAADCSIAFDKPIPAGSYLRRRNIS